MKVANAALTLFFLPLVASAGWFGPSNYDECILENMTGAAQREAAIMIRMACERKFPGPAPKAQPAPRPVACEIFQPESVDKQGRSVASSFVTTGCVPISKQEQRKLKAAGFVEFRDFTPIPDDGK